MPAQSRSRAAGKPGDTLRFLVCLVLLVGILYVAKGVIVPLALAVLLAFVLTPMVVKLQNAGLPRVPAALIVVVAALLVCGVVGWGVGSQLSKLADSLPSHADRIKAKIQKLRPSGDGRYAKLLNSIQDIGDATHKKPDATDSSVPATAEQHVVVTQESSALQKLEAVAGAVLEPAADTGLVLILVIFMLIRREDLRNRVIGLLGHGRLTGTTRVFVESARRISQLLLMQLCVNAGFGLVFSMVLLAIGVPYWLLWGFLTVILRFIPFIGSWVAAALPVLLSFAISPGWGQPLLVLAVFAVLDLLTSNVVEPLTFGHSTGVSPVALLIAAVFWTWIWGPIGLVLSTPLTVCLVVLGQHVPRLRFLSLLLGEDAPLAPHVAYYQRLLAGDEAEAKAIALHSMETDGLEKTADDVLLPALRLSRRDRVDAGLTPEDEASILESTEHVIDALTKACAVTPADEAKGPRGLVIAQPAHHRSEELIVKLLGCVLREARIEAGSTKTMIPELEARIAQERPSLVYLAVLPPGGVTQARYLCSRLRKADPELRIVVGYFGKVRDFDRLLVRLRSAGASYVTTSLGQSHSQILALLAPAAGAEAGETASTSKIVEVASV